MTMKMIGHIEKGGFFQEETWTTQHYGEIMETPEGNCLECKVLLYADLNWQGFSVIKDRLGKYFFICDQCAGLSFESLILKEDICGLFISIRT